MPTRFDEETGLLPRPIMVSPDRADPLDTEWLLTNGIGGYSMGTVLGVPTRRYHGLLVAAMAPPVDRVVALHSMDELVTIDRGSAAERTLNLTRFHFASTRDRPRTHPALATFTRGSECVWVYRLDGVRIEKRLHLFHGRNAVEIRYTIRAPGRRLRLQLRPLIALRGFHSLRRVPPGASPESVFQCRRVGMGVVAVADTRGLVVTSDATTFRPDASWWRDMHYERDAGRGQDHVEDVYTPGEFMMDSQGLDDRMVATIYATVDAQPADTPEEDNQRLDRRLAAMVSACRARARGEGAGSTDGPAPDGQTSEAIELLCAAADDFVVPRGGTASDPYGHPGRTVLAGFPWFADWGRDAMICVPGLLVSTGRLEDAQSVLLTFARHIRGGVIPNRFDDFGGPPHYNTADASLWFVHAVGELARAIARASGPGGEAGVTEGASRGLTLDPALVAACREVVEHYRAGTSTAPHPQGEEPAGPIGVDPEDGLVAAGDANTQLTWMDARRDGISFTPRVGKAVEINALWHHALLTLSELTRGADATLADSLVAEAGRVAASFRLLFWNQERGCLFDLVPEKSRPLGGQPAAQVRPNQIFAASLRHSPLTPAQRDKVIETIRRCLLTPVGLRTLDPADPGYKPRYGGTLRQRDEAYHNGTVWPWLLGAYVEATLRASNFTRAAREGGRALLWPLVEQMRRHCLGQIGEVYDGEAGAGDADPRGGLTARPDGCPAQAWSVAMTLRALLLTLGAVE